MMSLFLFLEKYFNRNIAIFSSLMFVISPIGFTISTLSEDTMGNNLILLLLVPFFFMFFNEKAKIRQYSMILLAFYPLIFPYYFILWPCCGVYTLLKNNFHSKKKILDFKNLKPYIIIFFITLIIFSPAYFFIYNSLEDKGHFPHEPNFIGLINYKIGIIPTYLTYTKIPFIPTFHYSLFNNLLDVQTIGLLSNISFIIYIFLLIISSLYFILNSIINKKIKPIFLFAIFPIIFILMELFLTHRWLDNLYRAISISTHYIKLLLFISFILISCFVYHKKIFRILAYAFILINLIINLSVLTSLSENNNFVNYNLGNENRVGSLSDRVGIHERFVEIYKTNLSARKLYILTNNHMISSSLEKGFKSREREKSQFLGDQNIDYKLYGFGIHLFYNNELVVNLCNFIPYEDKKSLCKDGYSMQEEEFKDYLIQLS